VTEVWPGIVVMTFQLTCESERSDSKRKSQAEKGQEMVTLFPDRLTVSGKALAT